MRIGPLADAIARLRQLRRDVAEQPGGICDGGVGDVAPLADAPIVVRPVRFDRVARHVSLARAEAAANAPRAGERGPRRVPGQKLKPKVCRSSIDGGPSTWIWDRSESCLFGISMIWKLVNGSFEFGTYQNSTAPGASL